MVSVYTWSLFTVPQIITCKGRSVLQHEAIGLSNKPTWHCDQHHQSTSYQIMIKRWLFIFHIFPLTVGTRLFKQTIICSVLVCNNIKHSLITRKSCKIQLKWSGVALLVLHWIPFLEHFLFELYTRVLRLRIKGIVGTRPTTDGERLF